MKHNRAFRVMAVAVILSLLMIALPATPASATPLIDLSISKGEIGDQVTVTGGGFRGSSYGTQGAKESMVSIYFSSNDLDVGDDLGYYDHYYTIVSSYAVVDGDGSFTKVIEVPAVLGGGDNGSKKVADVLGGTYYIYVTYSDDLEIIACAEFTVIGITEVDPDSGPVGTEVEINGVGFDGNAAITVKYDGSTVDIAGGDRKVKSTGFFSSSIVIPESAIGSHTITVTDEAGHSGQAYFSVTPQIVLDPNPASVGEVVTVTGTGFGKSGDLYVLFDGDEIYINGDLYTDSSGSFESTFVLAGDTLPGSYYVEVEDEYGNGADAELEVGASLTVEPVTTADSPGHVGDAVTLIGSGFTPDANVEISYETDPVILDTVEADASGDFEVTVTIPPSGAGEHTIIADDGTNTEEVTFIMESDAPEAPSLLLPADDDKLEDWTFDWEEVSDDSLPVSYELQIATSGQFSEESVILYKIEINSSEYTLTTDEKLDSTGDNAPYYWRVRAKDAASNTSAWTSGRAFTVSGFHMPLWLIITLIGVGVVGLFILGMWLGRRSNLDEFYDY